MRKLHGHKENTAAGLLSACVLPALPSNGFTCHDIITLLNNPKLDWKLPVAPQDIIDGSDSGIVRK
jgi:hypothetical protein